MARATYLQNEKNTLTVLVSDPHSASAAGQVYIKVSFFGTIGFGRVGEPEWTHDGVVQVASLDDLMATKVKVVLQRAEAKDYRDVAAMIRGGVSLSKGLASARAMFGPGFQPSESLKALVYFKDGDLQTLSLEDRSLLVRAVGAVRDLAHSEIISGQLTLAPSTLRPA